MSRFVTINDCVLVNPERVEQAVKKAVRRK